VVQSARAAVHEMSQPLTRLCGWTELLRDELGPDHPQAKVLEEVLAASSELCERVQRLAHVIR
jgi:hypothetical protein